MRVGVYYTPYLTMPALAAQLIEQKYGPGAFNTVEDVLRKGLHFDDMFNKYLDAYQQAVLAPFNRTEIENVFIHRPAQGPYCLYRPQPGDLLQLACPNITQTLTAQAR